LKLKLVLKVKNQKGKDSSIKFNIAPSKHIGFINFINYALKNERDVTLTFEKISTAGQKEESKVFGKFRFEGKSKDLGESMEEVILAKEKDMKAKKKKK